MASTATARKRTRLLSVSAIAVIVAAAVATGVTLSANGDSVVTTTTTSVPRTAVPTSSTLTAPTLSTANDAMFLSDVTEVDPALVTYEKVQGNVALRSLLTDGSAFCAFLNRDRNLDTAMVSVVVGARHVEAQTHLPLTVTTFNAVDSVALLTLCPTMQSFIPASALTKIRALGAQLSGPSS